jgi:predicted nucleic acid-binding protein
VTERAVADTGPLVAIIRKREKAHRKCVAALKTFRPPLLTCWPVLTEAAWLLRGEPGGIKALGGLVQSGSVKLVELDESALHWITAFLERYASAGVIQNQVRDHTEAKRECVRSSNESPQQRCDDDACATKRNRQAIAPLGY